MPLYLSNKQHVIRYDAHGPALGEDAMEHEDGEMVLSPELMAEMRKVILSMFYSSKSYFSSVVE